MQKKEAADVTSQLPICKRPEYGRSVEGCFRDTDTMSFNHVLYHLSYLNMSARKPLINLCKN